MAETQKQKDYLRGANKTPVGGNAPLLVNAMNRWGGGRVVDIVRYLELSKSKPDSELNPEDRVLGFGPVAILPGEGKELGTYVEYEYQRVMIHVGEEILWPHSKIRGYATEFEREGKDGVVEKGVIEKGMLVIACGFRPGRTGNGSFYPDPVVGFFETSKNEYVMRVRRGDVHRAKYDPEKDEYVMQGVYDAAGQLIRLPKPWLPPSHDTSLPYVGIYVPRISELEIGGKLYTLVETKQEETGEKK
jgi:hypothetical protein